MCGIVYIKNFQDKNVTELVRSRYKAQRSRGTEGFGYYIPKINRLSHNPDEHKLLKDLLNQDASEIMFHHRMPTSTANVQNACHPFSTKWDGFKHNFVMVHNGFLSNDDDLWEAHDKLGIKYVSTQPDGRFNDSEALLYDLALYAEGQQDAINARGAIAFVMIERDEAGNAIKLHYGRNTSPLKLQTKGKRQLKYMILASEGQGENVKPYTWFTYDYATKETTSHAVAMPGYVYQAQATNFLGAGWGKEWNSKATEKDFYYWTSNGDHYFGHTDPDVIDEICHYNGEDCPLWNAPRSLAVTSPKVVTATGSDGSAETLINMYLETNEWDTEAAYDMAVLDLINRESEVAEMKEMLYALEDETDEANHYLTISNELAKLRAEVKTLNKAVKYLLAQFDYERTLNVKIGKSTAEEEL